MNSYQSMPLEDERFFSSNKSQMAKTRVWLWLGVAIGLALAASSPGMSTKSLLLTAVLVLAFTGLLDWFIRRQLKVGNALATLTADVIESPIFPGKQKRYRWSEIADVSIETMQGKTCIQLCLIASTGKPDKRNFWSGINYARPFIQLTPFSQEDQERLLNAINLRVHRQHAVLRPDRALAVNQLAVEREFREQLKALAPHPWITYALVGINIIVWFTTLALGANVLHAPADKLLAWGGNAASEAQRGEWWRLLTSTFLHNGAFHLAMNMVGLVGAGITVERIYGHRLFALIYLGSGLMGSAMSLHFSAQRFVSVGASGAIFGVAGALLIAVLQHRKKLPKVFGKQTLSGIGFFIVYSLIQGFGKQGIDNAAHIGGLLGGCLLAFILPERFDREHFRQQLKIRTVVAIALISTAMAGLAVVAPPAAFDQRQAIVNATLFKKSLKGLDEAIKALQQEALDVKAGKLTEFQLDERGRTIYAPVFRTIFNALSQASLPPGDPREPFLKDATRLAELLTESLAMQSVVKDESTKPEPVDAQRMALIEAEVGEISVRMKKWSDDINARQKR